MKTRHTREEYRELTDLAVKHLESKKDREYQMLDLWNILVAKYPDNSIIVEWQNKTNGQTHARFPKFLLSHPNVASRKLGSAQNAARMVGYTETKDMPYADSDPLDKY